MTVAELRAILDLCPPDTLVAYEYDGMLVGSDGARMAPVQYKHRKFGVPLAFDCDDEARADATWLVIV